MDKADLDRVEALVAVTESLDYRRRWAYYEGRHPRVYATPKLHEVFRSLADSLTENYCALAAQTRVDRLEVLGWDGDQADAAQAVWDASRGAYTQDRLYRWALVHGLAYVIVDSQEQTLTFNPATVACAWPDPEDPEVLAWGGKVWEVPAGRRAVIYEPDRTLRLRHVGKQWEVVEEVPQPLGAVPIVEVRPFGYGPVLMDLIAPVQDRINKITANTMVAAEFGAFRQRVFFTRQDTSPYDLRNAPDHAIILDPGDPGDGQTRMQETTATDLANYDNSKNAAIDALFTIGQMPRHLRVNPGSPPSGDAIKADEGPLVQAIREHQREIGEALGLALGLLGYPDAEPIWRDPEVNDDTANAQVVATLVGAGVPWQVAVKKAAGWTDADVAEAELVMAQATTAGNVAGAAILQAFNTANPVAEGAEA